MMYAKVFTQILDSSLAENFHIRHMFEDMLKLCDVNGVVDMTHGSIARRLKMPERSVRIWIAELEKPDPSSRTPDHEGRRLVRLDDHRDWGWLIVNHDYYRKLASEEQRREKTRIRTEKWRRRKSCDAPVTLGDASDAMQKQKQKHIEKEWGSASLPLAKVIDKWNLTPGIKRCLVMSDKRRRQLETRLREPFFATNWEQAINLVGKSRFCAGENERGWVASFDWFIQPDSCLKVMEGKYDNRNGNHGYAREKPDPNRSHFGGNF